jgi:hypothetical protein
VGNVKKLLALSLGVTLLLAGCEQSNEQGSETEASEVQATSPSPEVPKKNIFQQGCDQLASGELEHVHLELYRPLVEDICRDFEMDYSLVDVVLSDGVDPEAADFYVDLNVFGLSYWDKRSPVGVVPRKVFLLMEEEQDWWSAELSEVLAIEPVWFGPSPEGGHCYRAEAEAFCPKLYVASEGDTKPGVEFDVFTTMLGSEMEWTTFRKVVPIHEATHGFHTATMLGQYRDWFIEGQATYFELAASVLVTGLGAESWREEQLVQAHRQDQYRFRAETVEESYDYIYACSHGESCEGYKYLGASFAHELLVNTYGIDKYFEWNYAMAEQLPDFNWKTMTQANQERGQEMFEEIFLSSFGVDVNTWEKDQFAPYLLEHYSN